MSMNYEQIINNLKNKIYHPVYFLTGEEPYYIDAISDFVEENILTDVEKEFNQTVVYGRDTDVISLISMAKRYPMMANHQVLIIKEAQDIKNIEELLPYIEKPLSSTVLVVNFKYRKIDKRKTFFRQIDKNGVLFESPKLYDNKVGAWINNYVKEKGYSISPKANAMLAEFLGSNLSKIVNEISKLLINIPDNATINDELVEKNIGISKDYNIFELQNAIGSKNVLKANQIANYFGANPKENSIVKTISMLFPFFMKLLVYHQLKDRSKNNIASALSISPFFVQDFQLAARKYNVKKLHRNISLLREYDLKSKGVDSVSPSEGELLKELLYKIIH